MLSPSPDMHLHTHNHTAFPRVTNHPDFQRAIESVPRWLGPKSEGELSTQLHNFKRDFPVLALKGTNNTSPNHGDAGVRIMPCLSTCDAHTPSIDRGLLKMQNARLRSE